MNAPGWWFLLIVDGACMTAFAAWFGRLPQGVSSRRRAATAACWLLVGAGGGLLGVALDHFTSVRQLDHAIYQDIVQSRTGTLVHLSTKVTEIGSVTTTLFVAALVGASVSYRWRRVMPLILTVGLWCAAEVARRLLDHASTRPIPAAPGSIGSAGGFPSGGVTRLVVVVGILGLFLLVGDADRRGRALVGACVGAVVAAEFTTRLVLGRHWPIDLIGGLWLGSCLLAAAAMAVRRAPHPEGMPPNSVQNTTPR